MKKQIKNKSCHFLFIFSPRKVLIDLQIFRTSVQLNECFDIFEKSYLSISLSRLSDPINLMFSNTTTKALPNQQELENLVKLMVKYVSILLRKKNDLSLFQRTRRQYRQRTFGQ